MGTWRIISVQIGPRHFVRADFERSGREVQEFRVILHTMAGPQDWLVRYETHGGTAHRHFRALDTTTACMPGPKSTPPSRAINDLKANWRAYDARYLAWMK